METEFTSGRRTAAVDSDEQRRSTRRHYSIFEVPLSFFDSCRLIESSSTSSVAVFPEVSGTATASGSTLEDGDTAKEMCVGCGERWTCNTCGSSFESLHIQRSHFKSDFHLLNVKLSIAGKDTVQEDDFDEWTSNSLVKEYDISSISGSEDETDIKFANNGSLRSTKQKICVRLLNGKKISFWKCLLLSDSEKILYGHDSCGSMKDDDMPCVFEREVTEKLRSVIHEPRDNTHFRVMLLASGGHFVGSVFDGNSVVAHKTFHRYVTRAKAGKKQSSKDASGKVAHSAGASIRRHNELVLKKDIQELLAAWKPYFGASACIFIHAPSHNHQLLFNGENPYFSCQRSIIRHIPLSVRRPTFKEAQRLYKLLTRISIETDDEVVPISILDSTRTPGKENLTGTKNRVVPLDDEEIFEAGFVDNQEITHISMPLHEAAKAGNVEKVLELLEQGLDPCVIDERGRTPYVLATEKEVRNTFRRFLASNLDKWDWQAAKVPGPLTKEMEESQNAKQVAKDAKRKTRAKELKKLRKARQKKAQDTKESHEGTRQSSGRVAGVLVLVIGSLAAVAFGQMVKGRAKKNIR